MYTRGQYGMIQDENTGYLVKMLNIMELKQSYGCGFIYFGVGIAILIIAALSGLVTYCMEKPTPENVSYSNLKMGTV